MDFDHALTEACERAEQASLRRKRGAPAPHVPEPKKPVITTLTSGGAAGADHAWITHAIRAGVDARIMSFEGHARQVPAGARVAVLVDAALAAADSWLQIAAKAIGRRLPARGSYTRKLLQRNYAIVKDAQAVYAVGKLMKGGRGLGIDGGTAWGCEIFALWHPDTLFFFDMVSETWLTRKFGAWKLCEVLPSPTTFVHCAGIGSRELTDAGRNAIGALFY